MALDSGQPVTGPLIARSNQAQRATEGRQQCCCGPGLTLKWSQWSPEVDMALPELGGHRETVKHYLGPWNSLPSAEEALSSHPPTPSPFWVPSLPLRQCLSQSSALETVPGAGVEALSPRLTRDMVMGSCHCRTPSEWLRYFVLRFVYLFLVALGLHCCTWAFSNCGDY